jgi:ubiquitin-like 1-activating enzyme E1 B
LYRQLFGEDEDAVGELDEAEKRGENGAPQPTHTMRSLANAFFGASIAQEIATLRKEALAFQAVRSALRSKGANEGDAAKLVFQKVTAIHSDQIPDLNP